MEHTTSTTDAKMHPALKVSISPPRKYDDLTFVGALDLLPKLVLTELEDMIRDVELAAYFYWGLLLVKIKPQQMPAFTETLPEGVCVVDNINSTTLVLQLTDLKTHGIKLPIVIEKAAQRQRYQRQNCCLTFTDYRGSISCCAVINERTSLRLSKRYNTTNAFWTYFCVHRLQI